MNDAVIVSTARTPIGKAYRGAFNNLESPTMGAHVLKHAIERAKVEPGEVDDVVMGAAMQEGTQGFNLARQSAMAAGWPVTVPGMTGSRCVGHALLEGKRRKAKYACVTMCIGGGMGAAGLFEIC